VRKIDHFEITGLDGRIILKLICKNCYGVINWIGLVQDMERWWACK